MLPLSTAVAVDADVLPAVFTDSVLLRYDGKRSDARRSLGATSGTSATSVGEHEVLADLSRSKTGLSTPNVLIKLGEYESEFNARQRIHSKFTTIDQNVVNE